MLQTIIDKAHSFGIDVTLPIVWAYPQINSEPTLSPSGIYYASTSLWGENDLDQWRSEAIGALGYSPNLRGLFDLAKYLSKGSGCSQVATIFVINSDTLKTHSNGSPINWAADWDFDYRYNKPYCTVERRGGGISDVAFKGVAMHELFHLFGAPDEYDGSSDCADQANCGLGKYGMLQGVNNNCYLCAGGNQDPCVMNDPLNQSSDVCWYTRYALGWYDPDNNGGGLVDDMPVDYTALVTGNFDLGDYFEVRTLSGYFVNAFRIADYNSYLQPDGNRTVQVLGMNYNREKIAPDIYYGSINGGTPFTFALNLNNSHPAATVSNYTHFGPYFQFTFNGVAHTNMKLHNPHTNQWWNYSTGNLTAGNNSVHEFLWMDQEWARDGTYPNINLGWACDGVNTPTSFGDHVIDYGPPGKWNMQILTFDPESEVAHAEWEPGSWTDSLYFYENNTDFDSIISLFGGWPYGIYYYNHIGSDSCENYLMATNPNGTTYSDSMYYITRPNPPKNVGFEEAYSNICRPDPSYTESGHKYPIMDDCRYVQVNQIWASCSQPDLQRTENITGYKIRSGHYEETPPGSHNYTWKRDSIFYPGGGGRFQQTMNNLYPNCDYSVNISTVDKFGGESENALSPWASVAVGTTLLPQSTPPYNNATKLNGIPEYFSVSQNHPNPFNPATTIELNCPMSTTWHMTIYNILGEKIREQSGQSEAGKFNIDIDLDDQPSGVYLYKIQAGEFTDIKKMILLK